MILIFHEKTIAVSIISMCNMSLALALKAACFVIMFLIFYELANLTPYTHSFVNTQIV